MVVVVVVVVAVVYRLQHEIQTPSLFEAVESPVCVFNALCFKF